MSFFKKTKKTLRFTREANYDLEWDVIVYENGYHPNWIGWLHFVTGSKEGWWFSSSDDSIKINLGPNVARAKRELKAAFHEKRLPKGVK